MEKKIALPDKSLCAIRRKNIGSEKETKGKEQKVKERQR